MKKEKKNLKIFIKYYNMNNMKNIRINLNNIYIYNLEMWL